MVAALGFAAVALATSRADADCASSCGDVCQAVEDSVFVRVEILSTTDGYGTTARIAEILGGSDSVAVAIGDELDSVYSQVPVGVGDSAFVTISRYSDSAETYVWNTAWPIRDGMVICDDFDPAVPLAQYVAMAISNNCVDISEDLEIANTCSEDVGGCSVGGGAVGGLAALLGFVLVPRRRSRRRAS